MIIGPSSWKRAFILGAVLSLAGCGRNGSEKGIASYGLTERTLWTTSRVVGSPEPPPQYRLRRVVPAAHLRESDLHRSGSELGAAARRRVPWPDLQLFGKRSRRWKRPIPGLEPPDFSLFLPSAVPRERPGIRLQSHRPQAGRPEGRSRQPDQAAQPRFPVRAGTGKQPSSPASRIGTDHHPMARGEATTAAKPSSARTATSTSPPGTAPVPPTGSTPARTWTTCWRS